MTLHCGCEAIQRRAHFAHGLSIRVANIERIWLATERGLHYDTQESTEHLFPSLGIFLLVIIALELDTSYIPMILHIGRHIIGMYMPKNVSGLVRYDSSTQ